MARRLLPPFGRWAPLGRGMHGKKVSPFYFDGHAVRHYRADCPGVVGREKFERLDERRFKPNKKLRPCRLCGPR